MEQNQLKELEKMICTLNKEPETEDNRLTMRETIMEIHGLLKSAKTVEEYQKIDDSLDTCRGILKLRYRDYVSLDFVPLPCL